MAKKEYDFANMDSDDILAEIQEEWEVFIVDAVKYRDKATSAAAGRARKASSNLTTLFKEYRKATVSETR